MGFILPGLLFLGLPLIGAVVLLYFLKIRRREVVTPSILFWTKALADMQANTPWQKLKPSWLLALQILAIILATAAVARPFVKATGMGGRDLVIVIDNSATMSATDVKPSRLEKAKQEATALLEGLGKGDRAMIIAASERTSPVSAFTADKKGLAQAIAQIEPTDLAGNMVDALNLAAANQASGRKSQTVMVSDGSFPEIPSRTLDQIEVRLVPIGTDSDNTGVSLLRSDVKSDGTQQIFVRVTHSGKKPRKVRAITTVDGQMVDARELSLEPGGSKPFEFALRGQGTGLLETRLEPSDSLAADDIARIMLSGPQSVKALLVGKGNYYLEQALSLDPRLEVSTLQIQPEPSILQEFDLIIWDRVSSRHSVGVPEVFISAGSPSAPATLGSRSEPGSLYWKRQALVSSGVELSVVRMQRFQALSVRPWAEVWAESDGQAIITAGELQGARKISFGWDFLESDMPLRVGFPILISNTLDWLLGGAPADSVYRPGAIVGIPSSGENPIIVTSPSGKRHQLDAGNTDFSQTLTCGIYQWKSGDEEGSFLVNLARAPELGSVEDLGAKGLASHVQQGKPRTNRDIYQFFLLALILILTLEWMVFHRRI